MHARIENGKVVEFPIANLAQRLPNVSLPSDLTNNAALPDGFVYIASTVVPSYDKNTHRLGQAAPQLVDGVWKLVFPIVQMTQQEAEEQAVDVANAVKSRRNQLLSECDWTQGKDIHDSVSAPWAVYRQSLRDISKQSGFPYKVEWPVAPGSERVK